MKINFTKSDLKLNKKCYPLFKYKLTKLVEEKLCVLQEYLMSNINEY